MAGDWLKMRTRLAEERAVLQLCELTDLDEFAVIGRLHAIWSWAGEHTSIGEVRDVTLKIIDRIARRENFGDAMLSVKWLEIVPEGGIRFPRWKKHNDKAARQRHLAAQRAARAREKKRALQRDAERDASVTSHAPREEKRREEKNINTGSRKRAGVFENVTAERLADTAWLVGWFEDASTRRKPVVGNSEANLLRVIGAAVRSLEVDDGNPAAVFVTIVAEALWANITAAQEDRAIERLREYRNSSSGANSELAALASSVAKGLPG